MSEFAEVVSREEFRDIPKSRVNSFGSMLVRRAILVNAARKARVIGDPADDVVLSTALEGNASYIISGDGHLLGLERFRGVRIVTVAEMLDILSISGRTR